MSYYLVNQILKEEINIPKKTFLKISLHLIDNRIKKLRQRFDETQKEIQYLSASDVNNNDKLKKKLTQLQRLTNRINKLVDKRNHRDPITS